MFRYDREYVPFEILKGNTLVSIEGGIGSEQVKFVTSEGEVFAQTYHHDCCAECSVEEIIGDLNDLIGTPILLAEEVSSCVPDKALVDKRAKEKAETEAKGKYYYDSSESETWTFYKLSTIKGSVTIRWYGSSNGYYSEAPCFELFVKESLR